MKNHFDDNNFETVFNDKPLPSRTTAANRAKAQRLQIMTKILENDMRSKFSQEEQILLCHCEAVVKERAKDFFRGIHTLLTVETVLYSRANSNTRQNPHIDLNDEYVGNALLAFVCLQPNTTLIIYPGSHDIKGNSEKRFFPRRYLLEAGDIIIFHPLLIHCGDSYVESNIRLHYYIFTKPNTTWENISFTLKNYALSSLLHDQHIIETRDVPYLAKSRKAQRKANATKKKALNLAQWHKRRKLCADFNITELRDGSTPVYSPYRKSVECHSTRPAASAEMI